MGGEPFIGLKVPIAIWAEDWAREHGKPERGMLKWKGGFWNTANVVIQI